VAFSQSIVTSHQTVVLVKLCRQMETWKWKVGMPLLQYQTLGNHISSRVIACTPGLRCGEEARARNCRVVHCTHAAKPNVSVSFNMCAYKLNFNPTSAKFHPSWPNSLLSCLPYPQVSSTPVSEANTPPLPDGQSMQPRTAASTATYLVHSCPHPAQ